MAGTTTRTALPKGFRSAELGWPELHRIPRPPHRVPLLGDVLGVNLRTPLQDSLRVGRQLGPIFRRKGVRQGDRLRVGRRSSRAELADESRFAKHVGLGVANLRPVAGDGLFTAYNHEPNWQLAHDVLAPGFSREAMEGYHAMMLEVTGRLTDRWDGEQAAGRAVDVPGDMTKLTLETIARTGFGHDFGSFERTRPHPFVTAMVGALTVRAAAQRRPRAAGPGAACAPPPAATSADMAYLNRTVDDVVEARRQRACRGRRPAGPDAGDGPSGDGRAPHAGEHPPPGHHLPDRRPRDDLRRALLRPALPRAAPRHRRPRPRGGRPRLGRHSPARPTTRSPGSGTYGASSTSRCACGRRRPRTPARPGRTPCSAVSIRCAGARGRWS